jgi:hypothetical protein
MSYEINGLGETGNLRFKAPDPDNTLFLMFSTSKRISTTYSLTRSLKMSNALSLKPNK